MAFRSALMNTTSPIDSGHSDRLSPLRTCFDSETLYNVNEGSRRKFGNTIPACVSLVLSVIYYRLISATECTWNVAEPWRGTRLFAVI